MDKLKGELDGRIEDSRLDSWIKDSRLTIIVGHFGTGKTEVAVNMAEAMGRLRLPFTFADLDIVDPYFRSREREEEITGWGGYFITNAQAVMDADVPAIPSETASLFDDRSRYGIMDIGGDPSGARVLARYYQKIAREQARVICVLNANRPLTRTPEEAASYIRAMEMTGGFRVTELINNTHLCGETPEEDDLRSAELCRKVEEMTGIPLRCHTVEKHLLDRQGDEIASGLQLREDQFIWPVNIYMKKPWEM